MKKSEYLIEHGWKPVNKAKKQWTNPKFEGVYSTDEAIEKQQKLTRLKYGK
jgi:hypothetical protein